jgi:hypothetical protein
MKISEKQLRSIIRESLNNFLLEHDPDEIEYDDDVPSVSSLVTFYFDPKTFYIVSLEKGWQSEYANKHPELGVCTIGSTDFPNAKSEYHSGDYWSEPYTNKDPGEPGENFEIEDFSMPEQYGDENFEEWVNKFIEINQDDILSQLRECADFD